MIVNPTKWLKIMGPASRTNEHVHIKVGIVSVVSISGKNSVSVVESHLLLLKPLKAEMHLHAPNGKPHMHRFPTAYCVEIINVKSIVKSIGGFAALYLVVSAVVSSRE